VSGTPAVQNGDVRRTVERGNEMDSARQSLTCLPGNQGTNFEKVPAKKCLAGGSIHLAPNCRMQLRFRVRLPSGLRIPDQFVCLPTSAHPSAMLVAELPPHSVRSDYCTCTSASGCETKVSMFGTSMFGKSKAERKEPDTADNISLSPPGPNFGLVHRVVFVDAWW